MPETDRSIPLCPPSRSWRARWEARYFPASSSCTCVEVEGGITVTTLLRRPSRSARCAASRASRSRPIRAPTPRAATADVVLIGVKVAAAGARSRRTCWAPCGLAAGVTIATFESTADTSRAAVDAQHPGGRRAGRHRARRGRERIACAGRGHAPPVRDRGDRRRGPKTRSMRVDAGSGPAYSLIVEEFTRAAVGKGFDVATARLMAEHTFIGAAALLEASSEDPAELRRRAHQPRRARPSARSRCRCRPRTSRMCSPKRRMLRSPVPASSRPATDANGHGGLVSGRSRTHRCRRARHDDQVVVGHDRLGVSGRLAGILHFVLP